MTEKQLKILTSKANEINSFKDKKDEIIKAKEILSNKLPYLQQALENKHEMS